MRYSIETTENGVNETLEVDVNKKALQTKWKMRDTITSHCLKKLMRSLTASLLVPLTI